MAKKFLLFTLIAGFIALTRSLSVAAQDPPQDCPAEIFRGSRVIYVDETASNTDEGYFNRGKKIEWDKRSDLNKDICRSEADWYEGSVCHPYFNKISAISLAQYCR